MCTYGSGLFCGTRVESFRWSRVSGFRFGVNFLCLPYSPKLHDEGDPLPTILWKPAEADNEAHTGLPVAWGPRRYSSPLTHFRKRPRRHCFDMSIPCASAWWTAQSGDCLERRTTLKKTEGIIGGLVGNLRPITTEVV